MIRWPFRWMHLWMLALLLALSAILGIAWYGSGTTLPARMTVEDWSVGGLGYEPFERQMAAKIKRLKDRQVHLVANTAGGTLTAELTFGQLGLRTTETELLARLRDLRTGTPFERAAARWHMRNVSLPLPASFDPAEMQKALRSAFPTLYTHKPKNAQRIINDDDTIRYVPEVNAERVNEQQLADKLHDILPGWGEVEWSVNLDLADEDQPEAAVSIASLTPSHQASQETAPPLTVRLPLHIERAEVTQASLQAQGIVRKLSEYTTRYTTRSSAKGTAGRRHNVCSTASMIHDLVLKPGEVFDYAVYIEKTEKRYGYREAPVIINGNLVPGVGGGICQVSSTLYNAVLKAGLAIVERRNHTLPVSYVPLGLDATFASGYINFKFRNSTKHHLLIRTSGDDSELTVKIFGQAPKDITYDIRTKKLATIKPAVKYVHNPTLPRGVEQTLTPGKPGYIVETYRYTRKNGVVIAEEKLSRDTYTAQPKLVAVNNRSAGGQEAAETKNGRTGSGHMVEDGVKGSR